MAYLNITVVDYLPTDFTYNPDDLQLTNNTASADLPLAPQLTGPGEILSWELNNTNLPSGILFGSNNGTSTAHQLNFGQPPPTRFGLTIAVVR